MISTTAKQPSGPKPIIYCSGRCDTQRDEVAAAVVRSPPLQLYEAIIMLEVAPLSPLRLDIRVMWRERRERRERERREREREEKEREERAH